MFKPVDLLIGKSNRQGIFNLFKIIPYRKKKTLMVVAPYDEGEDLSQEIEIQENLPRLPFEIIKIILLDLMKFYLRNKAIPEACQLLGLSRTLIFHYHRRYVGTGPTTAMQAHQGLCRLFFMVDSLHQLLSGFVNFERYEYFMVEMYYQQLTFPSTDFEVTPLHFYNPVMNHQDNVRNMLDLVDCSKPILHSLFNFKAVVTGPKMLDVAWVFGRQGTHFYHCQRFQRPVICFVLNDQHGALAQLDEDDWQQVRPWKMFADLIRLVYGPSCGVYLVVDGPLVDGVHDTTYEMMELV